MLQFAVFAPAQRAQGIRSGVCEGSFHRTDVFSRGGTAVERSSRRRVTRQSLRKQ